jgi:hypothetical protein
MTRIKEIVTLAKLCYAQANDTLNPEAKKTLQDIGNQYAQKAEELRRIEITRAVFPATKSRIGRLRIAEKAPAGDGGPGLSGRPELFVMWGLSPAGRYL